MGENRIVCICSEDRTFSKRLASHIKTRKDVYSRVLNYRMADQLKQMLLSGQFAIHRFVFFMISENVYLAMKNWNLEMDEVWPKVVILRETTMIYERQLKWIHNYLSPQQMVRSLIRYENAKESEKRGERKTRIISIYAPISSNQQTSFAILLAQRMSQIRKVLYLDLEPYSGYCRVYDIEQSLQVQNLFTSVSISEDLFDYKLWKVLHAIGNMDYLSHQFSYRDLEAITEEAWLLFLERIEDRQEYEYIVINLSDHIHGLLSIIDKSSRIYTLVRREGFLMEGISMAKEEQVRRIIYHRTHLKGVGNRFQSISTEIYTYSVHEMMQYIGRVFDRDFTVYKKIRDDGR